jgi:hypothetical protein
MAPIDTKFDPIALLAQRLQHLQDDGIKLNPATANPGGHPVVSASRQARIVGCGDRLWVARQAGLLDSLLLIY